MTAVVALSRSLASELGPRGVRVNTVIPGPTYTPLAAGMQSEEAQRRRAERTPDGRLGWPEEVAGAIVFLASECSSHISGAELAVDGGFSVAGILGA
ncbi:MULTISPECIES: SDR family oxidoreductase [unclassified Microbacterium]|uniref:SDR family oxidoreductase n=1 Tax=unclassified Microbacterium TaxID=2609290 RepID=UPI000C2C942E